MAGYSEIKVEPSVRKTGSNPGAHQCFISRATNGLGRDWMGSFPEADLNEAGFDPKTSGPQYFRLLAKRPKSGMLGPHNECKHVYNGVDSGLFLLSPTFYVTVVLSDSGPCECGSSDNPN
jgi:hypothetical protein